MSNPIRERGNWGHGHVYPRPDGMTARCGGPKICERCSLDLANKFEDESEEGRLIVAVAFPPKSGKPLSGFVYERRALNQKFIREEGPSDWYSSGEEDGQPAQHLTEEKKEK